MLRARGMEEQTGCLDRVACDDDVLGLLPPPLPLAMIDNPGRQSVFANFDLRHHREITDFRPRGKRPRQVCVERALLGVGRAAALAEAAIHAWMCAPTRRRQGGERRRAPLHAKFLCTLREYETRGVDLMLPVGIAPARRAPG